MRRNQETRREFEMLNSFFEEINNNLTKDILYELFKGAFETDQVF